MDNIILYLLTIIQEQHQQICWLILFICRYIPLKQWAHDESTALPTRSLLLTNFPLSNLLSNRIGSFGLNTIVYIMATSSNRSNLRKAKSTMSRKILSVLFAVLHMTTFMITMAVTVSFSAKYAAKPSLPVSRLPLR